MPPNWAARAVNSATYPDYQFTVRGDVDQTFGAGFTAKLTEAILAFDDKDILGFFDRSKFIPAKNADYKPIEEIAEASKLLN